MKRNYRCKFNLETEREICRLYKLGVHFGSIALGKKFACHNGSIINILKAHKTKIRTNSESQIGLQTGKNHPGFKGGNISKSGYKRIYVNKKLVLEHRHIMEKNLGRPLMVAEIIHHINHDKLDNQIENLQIVSRSEHKRLHPEIGLGARFKSL